MSKRKYVIFTLVVNGLIPWILYVTLSNYMSSVEALSIAALAPLVDNVVHLAKHRKIDVFGGLMLFTLVLTIGLVLLGGNEKIILIRESLITASVGVLFIGSLLRKKPLMFSLGSRFLGEELFHENWQYPYFRFVMRTMTMVWGLILLCEAAVRVILVYSLSTAVYLAVSNVVFYGFIGAAILWTIFYRKKSRVKLERIKADRFNGGGGFGNTATVPRG
ncbi:VC0807 family protein [Falsibacillus pallidus]|uniref:Intracellular septation protein A n=1 Tax=Falsibacillus pallidus TaxID=493781 RepID=A0A370GHG1_9BACI|nr:VC0807 family protein [Falsibacillus pallidus]RDI41363.1 intracellular septation protein A [Falsibacillus pallidus]